MKRLMALLFAVLLTAITFGSAGFATEPGVLGFRLSSDGGPGSVELNVRSSGEHSDSFSNHYGLDELNGLTPALLSSVVMTPARFSLQREAGRLDCKGSVGGSTGRGQCWVFADPAFANMLAQRGIARPDGRETFLMVMTGANRAQLDALAASRFPRPTVKQLIGLAIFKVTPADIRGLANAGRRTASIEDLIAFKIHGITPAFINSFAQIGYRDLPASKLTELRIFGVTPDDVRRLQVRDGKLPELSRVVQSRILGAGWDRR